MVRLHIEISEEKRRDMEEIGKVLVDINGERSEKVLYRRQNGFDGMTGQPVMEEVVQKGFDGQTGEAVYVSVEKNGFDGQTGAPVYKLKSETESIPSVEDVAGVQAAQVAQVAGVIPQKKNKLPIIIAGVAAAVVIVGVGAFAAIKSGLFMSKQEKIIVAASDTLKEDTFGNVMVKAGELLNGSAMTTTLDVAVDGSRTPVNVSGTLAVDGEDGKIKFDGKGEIMGASQSVQAFYDDSKIQFAMPDASDTVFEYNYVGENKGFIADRIESSLDMDIDDFNQLFVLTNESMKKSDEFNKVVRKKMRDAVNEFEVDSLESKTFEIDEKERKCDGYTIHVTEKSVEKLLDAYEDAQKDVYGDTYEKMEDTLQQLNRNGSGAFSMNSSLTMDNMRNAVEDMDDFDVDVYLYDGKLAAIEFDADTAKISVEFKGGDHRTSNMEINYEANGVSVSVEKESSIEDGVEKGKFKFAGQNTIKYSYDTNTGEFKINNGEETSKANFLVSDDEITIGFDGDFDGSAVDVDFKITKGAEIEEIDGDIFDVGNADEADLQSEASKIMAAIMGF